MFNYFSSVWGKVPYCFLLTAGERGLDDMPSHTQKWAEKGKVKVLYWGSNGAPIESLNYDTIGTLQTYDKNGPVRDALEYPLKRVAPYHEAMRALIDRVKPFETLKIAAPLSSASVQKRVGWMNRVNVLLIKQCDVIRRQRPAVSKYISHVARHQRKRVRR